jgi:hypothetical protein
MPIFEITTNGCTLRELCALYVNKIKTKASLVIEIVDGNTPYHNLQFRYIQ